MSSEDIRFQLNHLMGTGATYSYFNVPYRCTRRNVIATLQGDIGDASETITISYDGNTHAVLTADATPAAGETITFAANATYGDTVIPSGGLLTFTGSAGAANNVHLNIELDMYARDA